MSGTWSELADALDALPAGSPTGRCRFGAWLDTLDPEDAARIWALVQSTVIPYRTLATTISRHGYNVSPSTINNHRKGDCGTCRSRMT